MRNSEVASDARPKRTPSNEFVIWQVVTSVFMVIASGVFNGIWHWSYGAGRGIVDILACTMAPLIAWQLSDAPAIGLRRAGRGLLILWTLGLAYVVLITADRLWLVNGASYPSFLAKAVTVGPLEARTVYGHGSLCGVDKGVGFVVKKDNGVFMRCGFEWRPGNTFLIENYDEATRMWNDAHPETNDQESAQ